MKETTKKKLKKIVIELTYNQYVKLYQGTQFLRVKRNHKIYYINYIRHIGEYYATDWTGTKCDNVEVIGY